LIFMYDLRCQLLLWIVTSVITHPMLNQQVRCSR